MADEKKVMDVARPEESKPDTGAKPMVIGHKSMASDPTLKSDSSAEEGEKIQVVKKNRIEPLSEQNTASAKADENNSAETVNSAEKTVDTAEETKTIETPAKEASPEETAEKVEATAKEEKAEEKKDEAETKAEAEQAVDEKEAKLQELIKSKKYVVPIRESHGSNKKTLVWLIGLLLAALIGLFIAIDTGVVDLGVKLPFSLFGKEEATEAPAQVTRTEEAETETVEKAETGSETSSFQSRALALMLEYPSTIEPSVDGIGGPEDISDAVAVVFGVVDKETKCCGFTLEQIVSQDTENSELKTLYDEGGLEAVAAESRRVNIEDDNEFVENKTVGELTQTTLGTFPAYTFSVTGSYSTGFFDDTTSGMLLDKPMKVFFIETNSGVVRIYTQDGDGAIEILNSLDKLVQ